jgi:hypothetical protein
LGLRSFELRRGSLRLCSCVAAPREARRAKRGGARRDRTDDLMLAKHALSQLSYGPVTRRRMLPWHGRAEARVNQPAFACQASARQPSSKKACRAEAAKQRRLVGLGRLELPTSRLSSARSNQLSYKPLTLSFADLQGSADQGSGACARASRRDAGCHRTSAKPPARVRPRRKRNEDGEIPPMELNNPEIAGP